jgi:hypothetical protein
MLAAGAGGMPAAGSGGMLAAGSGGMLAAGAGGMLAGGAGSGGMPAGGAGGAPAVGLCGNGVIEAGESCSTCVADCGPCATGKLYHVSTSEGDDGNDGLSAATPWKSLSRVESAGKGKKHLLAAGDSVLFKRGDTFVGTLQWDNFYPGAASVTGEAGKPLTFASYGSGPKPRFEYPPITPDSPAPADRRLMGFFGIDYMVVDGLEFTDSTIAAGDKMTIATMGIALQFGVYNEAYAHHCTVQNVDMSRIGLGVVIVGDFNTVDHCTMVDLKNLVDTKCADPNDTGMCSYEDYGANGITLTGNDNFITSNYFSGNYAHSYDFVYNGGAIEAFADSKGFDRNTILYNTAIDCDGFMEIGSNGEGTAKDTLLAYNLFINNGSMTYASLSGVFATDVSNVQYVNNTVIETPSSRYAGQKDAMLSAGGPVTATTLFRVINNVFYLTAGDTVFSSKAPLDKYVHDHNLFHFEQGSAAPFALDPSEILAPGALFVDTTGPDPSTWDAHLLPGAPGQGAAQDADFTRDHDGAPPGSPPDIGAFESP